MRRGDTDRPRGEVRRRRRGGARLHGAPILTTRDPDLEPAGTRGYEDLVTDAEVLRVALDPPLEVPVASLADIIRSKEAAGREKDRAMLPLLRRTLEEIK